LKWLFITVYLYTFNLMAYCVMMNFIRTNDLNHILLKKICFIAQRVIEKNIKTMADSNLETTCPDFDFDPGVFDGIDAGEADAGKTDAGKTDAGEADADETDAGKTDAGKTDAGKTDAGKTDAGEADDKNEWGNVVKHVANLPCPEVDWFKEQYVQLQQPQYNQRPSGPRVGMLIQLSSVPHKTTHRK
jgi:hypothetical protein